MEFIVAVDFRIAGEKKVQQDYKQFATLDEAKAHVARWVQIFKPSCDVFDARIYEITNY